MDFTKEIDYTTLSSYIACPRKFFFRHVLNLKKDEGTSIDLHFGKAFHTGLEAAYLMIQGYQERGENPAGDLTEAVLADLAYKAFMEEWDSIPHGFDPDLVAPKSPAYAADCFLGYMKTYRMEMMRNRVLGVELSFSVPIMENFNYIGRMDLVDEDAASKTVRVVEHKTTKYDNLVWQESWRSNFQVEGYLAAGYAQTGEMPMVIVNGAKLNKTKISYPRVPIQKSAAAIERFLAEVAAYIVRLNQEYEELMSQLEGPHKALLLADPTALLTLFPRNCYSGGPCTMFFRTCEYMDYCQMRNNPMTWYNNPPSGYVIDEWDPRDPDGRLKKGQL